MESKKQLKEKILKLEETIKSKDEDIQMLRSRLSGKHICSAHCSICVHSIMSGYEFLGGKSYVCDLEVNCKDFERK